MGSVMRGALAKGPASETWSDPDLTAQMRAQFAREPWASNRGIWVEAREGMIALVGVVNSETEKAGLAAMAREIDGCRGVENHLLVRSKKRDFGVA